MSSQPAYSRPDNEPIARLDSIPVQRPRRRKRPFVLALLLLVLVWVVSIGVLLFCPPVLESVSAIWLKPQPGAVPWNGTDRITVVAMGLTQRTTEPARTDTLLVMDVDPGNHRINMLSVPRDLWVKFPGQYGQGKLAIPYALGGSRLTAYTLEQALGIPVDYTISMKFRGFMKLVNAMGGVNVNVPQELNDPLYPCLTGYDYCPIDIKKGTQHMNGATALEFVRERHAFSQQDLARVQDQQAFSEAVKSTLISPATWPRYPQILSTLKSALITNMPMNDLPALGASVVTTPKSRVDHQYINIQNGLVQTGWSNDGQSILTTTNSTAIPNLIHRLFGDPTLSQENAPVEILNGTPTGGVASDLQGTLQGLGFHVVGNGNASGTDYPRTQVVVNDSVQGTADYTARRLQRILDADLVHESLPNQSARIVVIVGKDFPIS
jgi:LCP family protein required for cell wall assembly